MTNRQAITKTLYTIIPFTVMSLQHDDGLWECSILEMPHTGAFATTQREAEEKAQYAAQVSCLYMLATYKPDPAICDQAFGVDNEPE